MHFNVYVYVALWNYSEGRPDIGGYITRYFKALLNFRRAFFMYKKPKQ